MAMRVAMISAECEPWAKTGGLADVVDALARALGRVDGAFDGPIEVFLPRYRDVLLPPTVRPGTVVSVPDPVARTAVTDVTIIEIEADGYTLRLVDHPPAFDRDGYYGDWRGDHADNAWRFGLFCRAALETLRADGRPVDIIHAHDWHASPAAILRDTRYADDPVVGRAAILHTVHNVAYHGWTARDRIRELGLVPGDGIVPADAERFDLLAAGIARAELVNTVSPGFASEALTPAYGSGLDGLLRSMGDRFFGILNGLDTEVWDPSTDATLAATYGRDDMTGKAVCRADLLAGLGFDAADDRIVLGMIGRLDPQKGFDLVAAAAPRLLDLGARLIVLGSGRSDLADPFRVLASAHPGRVALLDTFDRALARRIYAGVDAFLMPSRFEPCGQGQMIALRYGTPPIVRRTGGLADSVVDVEEHPAAGTGFVFNDPTPAALLDACAQATAMRNADDGEWRALADRGMAVDFDWGTGPARAYVEAYRRAIDLRSR
jgi:starch synthase